MLTPGTLLQSRYQIVRPIGQGGMGAVYLARDQRLGHTVAIKETFFTDARMRRAFEREARLLAQLRHPALPKVSDHFEEGDGQFLVMEFISGNDLEVLLAERGAPFEVEQVLHWGDQLLDALDYLHTQEEVILHRDIKPSNLKLTSRGQIILLDFGLAKGSAGMMSSVATSRSVVGFTPNFAPIEQIHGSGTEARSDLYALAATLYYLMTYALPADTLSRASAVLCGETDPLRPAHEVNPKIPLEVSDVLRQAMSLTIELRPASAAEMREALRTAQAHATHGSKGRLRPDEPPEPTSNFIAHNSGRAMVLPTVASPQATLENAPQVTGHNTGGNGRESFAPNQSGVRMPPLAPAPSTRSSKLLWIIGGLVAALAITFSIVYLNRRSKTDNTSTKNTSVAPEITAADAKREGIAAIVNGQKIMLAEVDRLVNQQIQGQSIKLDSTQLAQARLQVLTSLIQQEAVFQRAAKENLLPTEDEITVYIREQKTQSGMAESDYQKFLKDSGQTEEMLRSEVRRQLAIQKLQEKHVGPITVTDQEVADYYNNNPAQFTNQRRVGLSAIVADPRVNGRKNDAKSESEAQLKIESIYQQLQLGADFAELARQQSEDNSGANGGDLGFANEETLTQNGFSPELIAQFFGPMTVGSYTTPVRFANGNWCIFKLTRKQLATENLTLETPGVRDQIRQTLVTQRQEVANAALIESTMNETRVVNFLAAAVRENTIDITTPTR